MPHSDSAQATANQVGLAVRSGAPRSTYDGGSLDRHRYRRLDAGGRHRDDGHASARLLGGAARVVDSSSSLEFERVVDAQIPRSRVHLRARAARHEHAAVRKSLTSERQRLICQASMYKVHGEVFDYTEAFSRNIGLASGRTTLLSVRSPRANVQDRLSARRQSQPDSAGRAMVGSPYKPRSSRCCRETRPLALLGVFCRWIGIGVTSVAAAIVTCHEVDVQKLTC